ncbi:MAG: DUF3794 domain-containing protein [Clostridia bacterium]|nr:DUF3794 domain-containing protein [Clostridia bacterium]
MEHKNLKTSVYSLDKVFSDCVEQPIDIDFTLPDYCSDISKILKCRAVPRISSKSVSGNSVSVEGCVTITVMYCGNDNCVNSYEYLYPFSKKFDTGMDAGGTTIEVKTNCEYINCRAVSGRKIDIHGAVSVSVSVLKRRYSDVISDYDDCNIELLRGSVAATVPIGMADKYLIIEEDVELGAAQPDIRCIIRYDAEPTVTDSKILAGKSIVSGELNVKILYLPENSDVVQTVRCQLPFSQMLEIDGITEDCDCESKVSVAHLEIKPRISHTGECRQLLLSGKLLITSECCCNNDIEVVLDAYSRKYEADICKKEICFNKIIENVNQTFSCKDTFEFTEGALSSVSDMWCDIKIATVKFNNDKMTVTGIATIFIIAQDEDMIHNFYEKSIDFEFSCAFDMQDDCSYKCEPEITVRNLNYTLIGNGSMELRVELNICAAIYKCSQLPLITDISVDDAKPILKQNQSAMTIYFAHTGEKIWDIAHKYFAQADEIKQINNIDEEVLSSDKMILIPTI